MKAVATPGKNRIPIRQLSKIQEHDDGDRPSRTSALVMASFGGACIVFAALVLMRSPVEKKTVAVDPLGDLVARSYPAGTHKPAQALEDDDISFPSVLSDQKNPTTAMELVRSTRKRDRARARGEISSAPVPEDTPAPAISPMLEGLPAAPVPAQDVLAEGKVASRSNDSLRTAADQLAAAQERGGVLVDSGKPGKFQLQVSSFKKIEDASAFARALRRRGHRAHVESAQVKGRGLWHRVRIGPFKYKRSAQIYRQDFEAKERMVTFIIDPPKTRVRIEQNNTNG